MSRSIEEYLDNTTSPMGIQKFAWDFLPDFTKNKTPDFHEWILKECLYNYYIGHKSKYDRRLAIVAFRGSAKTTITTQLLPIYNIIFKGYTSILDYKGKIYELLIGEDLIVITSKTSYSAIERVTNIRNIISTQNKLTDMFGMQKPQVLRSGEKVAWREGTFTTTNDTSITGLGAGMLIRGLNIRGHRPTLWVPDDMYSMENTKTPESRQKLDQWFYTEALGSVDDISGKVIFIGTIVHEDTVPVKIRNQVAMYNKNSQDTGEWRYIEIPAIDPEEFHSVLKRISYDRFGNKFEMPSVGDIKDWQSELKTIAWPDRLDLRYILNLYRDNLQGKSLDYMYQEYLHIIQAPENKQFTEDMFTKKKVEFKREKNINYVYIDGEMTDKGEKRWLNCNVYFGIDLASNENAGSDDTVIMIIAVTNDHRMIVLQYIHGKMGQRDETYEKTTIDTFRKAPGDIKKIGVVDETLRQYERYRPSLICVEVVSEQRKTYMEIIRVARMSDIFPRVVEFKPTTDKIERITSNLIGWYQTGSVIHQPWMNDLEYQLEKLGKAKHDDIADALHIAVHYAMKPEKVRKDDINIKNNRRPNYVQTDWQLL